MSGSALPRIAIAPGDPAGIGPEIALKAALDPAVRAMRIVHTTLHVSLRRAIDRTAGLTIGTPILFSSVAHGSAHDIAGRNKAGPRAMIEAIRRLAGASTIANSTNASART